jgi:hypothetical protein
MASLAILRRQHPLLYARMSQRLGRRTVRIEVDGETVTLGLGENREVTATPPALPWSVRSVATKEAILRVVDGHITLEAAILSDQIEVYGDTADILGFYDALQLYVQGAVRSPRFPALLRRYRHER